MRERTVSAGWKEGVRDDLEYDGKSTCVGEYTNDFAHTEEAALSNSGPYEGRSFRGDVAFEEPVG